MRRRIMEFAIVTFLLLMPFALMVDDGPSRSNEVLEANPVGAPTSRGYSSGWDASFTENRGQVSDPDVRFYSLGDTLSVKFLPSSIEFSACDPQWTETSLEPLFRIKLPGEADIEPIGGERCGHVTNFLLGDDPQGWTRGVESFRDVVYRDVHEGIDLRFYIEEGKLKYDLTVPPGSDPSSIWLEYEGVLEVEVVEGNGDLAISTSAGVFYDSAPIAYQPHGDLRIPVECAFRTAGVNSVGFKVGAYDRELPLVIDPALRFSTYFKGPNEMIIPAANGSLYLGGHTEGMGYTFPPGSYSSTPFGKYDCSVARFNDDASALEYLTYIGGSSRDWFTDMEFDEDGNLVIIGFTESDDLPVTSGAYCTTKTSQGLGRDSFLWKLDPTLSQLMYGTYLGGSGSDLLSELAIGENDTVYMAGENYNGGFPTTQEAYCRTDPHPDLGMELVALALSLQTSELVFSTYIVGNQGELLSDMYLDDMGRMTLLGATGSQDYPVTTDALQPDRAGYLDVFVTRLEADGTDINYSSYWGGSEEDVCYDSAVDDQGRLWMTGVTKSTDLPMTDDAFQGVHGGFRDAFLVRLSKDLGTLEYSTYIGGLEDDECRTMTLNAFGDPVVALISESSELPLPKTAYNGTYNSGQEIYLAWFDATNGRLVNGTWYGGSSHDYVRDVVIDGQGDILVSGSTGSSLDFPLSPGCFDDVFDGGSTAWMGFFSALEMGRTPWNPLPAPTNFSVVAGDEKVDVDWDPVDEDDTWPLLGYNIYMREEAGPEVLVRRVKRAYSQTFDGLENGRRYTFRVRAVDMGGNGLSTDARSAVPHTIPTQPQSIEAMGMKAHVALVWTPPFDPGGPLLGYNLYRGTTASEVDDLINTTLSKHYKDYDVVNGTEYFYEVTAFHEFGEGSASLTVSAIPWGSPGPPANVAVTAGDQTVSISWSPPVNDGGSTVVSFTVYRGTEEDDLSQAFEVETDLSHVDGDVINGVTYYYAVSATNYVEEGPLSIVISVVPRGLADPPGGLEAKAGDGTVTLSWEPPSDTRGGTVLEYRVLRGMVGEDPEPIGSSGLNTTYVDEAVENGMTYHYQVVAVTEAGVGQSSSIVVGTPMGVPGPPDDFALTTGIGRVELVWFWPVDSGGSDITGFTIYRGDPTDEMEVLEEVGGSVVRFVDDTVENGSRLFYSVSASNALFEGARTGVLEAIVPGPPTVPIYLTATPHDGGVELMWTAPVSDGGSPLTGYIMFSGTDPDTLSPLAQLGVVLSYTVTGLENGQTYHFSVAAKNDVGTGPVSEMVSSTPLGVPGVPRQLVTTSSKDTVTLTWEAPEEDGGSPVSGYVVLRGTTASDLEAVAELGDVGTYTDEGLERGTTYFYSVSAKNTVGDGDPAQVVKVDVKPKKEDDSPSTGLLGAILAIGLVVIVLGRRRGH